MRRTWGSLLLLTLLLLKSTVVSSDAVFSKQDGAHNEMVDSKQDGGSVGEKQDGGREGAPEEHADGDKRSLDTSGSIQAPVVVTDPMMASATSYGKGHKKGHKSKSHKSGYKSVKGKKGKKGYEAKKGKKSDKKGHYKKGQQKKYHDKKGKKHKKDDHKKKYYGSVKKAKKGKKGFKHGSKGHHKKGHKDKGFKNVYHKEEYQHKKKFYDDKDSKKHHKKHDKGFKSFKGKKGKDYKGDKSKDLEYGLDPGLDAGSTEDSKDIKPKSLDQQIVDLKAAVRRLRMKLGKPIKNKKVAGSKNTEEETHKISAKKSISLDKKKVQKNDSLEEGKRHESKLTKSSSGGANKNANFTLMNTIARKLVNVRQAKMKKLKEQLNKNRKGKPDKNKHNDVTANTNDTAPNFKKADIGDKRTKSKNKLISKQDIDYSERQSNNTLKKDGRTTKGSIRSKNKKPQVKNKKGPITTDKSITKRKTKHRPVRKSHATKKPKEIKTQSKISDINTNEKSEEKTSNGTVEHKDGKKEATTETKAEENVKAESKAALKTEAKKTGKSGITGVKDSKKTKSKKMKAVKPADKKVKIRPARFKRHSKNVKYSLKRQQEKDSNPPAKSGRRHKRDTRKVEKYAERHHEGDSKGKKAEKTTSALKSKDAKLTSKSAPSEGDSTPRISVKESHENKTELPKKSEKIKPEKDPILVEKLEGRQFGRNSSAPHVSERRTRHKSHSKSQLKDRNLERKQHRHTRTQNKIRGKIADVPIKSKFRNRSKRESEKSTKMTRDEHLKRVKRHFKEMQSKIRSDSISDSHSDLKTASDKLSAPQEKLHGNSAKVSSKGTSSRLGSLKNKKKSRTHKEEMLLPAQLVSSKSRNLHKEGERKSSNKGRRNIPKKSPSSKTADTDRQNSRKNTNRISKHKTNGIKLRPSRFTIDLENPKFIPHLHMGIKYKDEFGKKGKSKKGHHYDKKSDHKKKYDKKSFHDHKSKHELHLNCTCQYVASP